MTALNIRALIAANTHRWAAMRIHPERLAEVDRVVQRLWTPITKPLYQDMADAVGIPVLFIPPVHERESSGDWTRSLAQGDLLSRRSTHVPAGRIPPPAQPPFTFKAAAIDALVACDHVNLWHDWSIGGLLTKQELYNGDGYALHGVASPYPFGATDQYTGGKYVADHVFDPTFPDPQLGTAAMIARMMHYDAELAARFGCQNHPAVLQAAAQTPPAPHQTVEWLQASLNTIGQHEPFRAAMVAALAAIQRTLPLKVDGDYGAGTKEAVRGYQRAHGGLLSDGKAGDMTRAAIEKTLASLAPSG